MNNYFEKLIETRDYIKTIVGRTPHIAIVLGSGLGPLADQITEKKEINYDEIPNFPKTTVVGHEGKLIFGFLGEKYVVAMKGRFHYYEGFDIPELIFPVRVFKLLGIDNIILTNAAGGVNNQFKPGDLMLIKDHIGFYAESALRGANIDEFGPRFPDMSQVYSKNLNDIACECAKKHNINLRRGIYSYTKGPMFETTAEIRALGALGADAVGMSTVPEAIAAKHAGMKVLGISCITNMAAGILDQPLTHEEVMETGKMVEEKFSTLITEIVKQWP